MPFKNPFKAEPRPKQEPEEHYGLAIRIARRLSPSEKSHLIKDEAYYMNGNHTYLALIDYQKDIVNEYSFGPDHNSFTYLPTKGHIYRSIPLEQRNGQTLR